VVTDVSPVARSNDPDISWAAAFSAEERQGLEQQRVLALLDVKALTGEEMVDQLAELYGEHGDGSGWRTRRNELYRMGLVDYTGRKVPGRSGRATMVFGSDRLVQAELSHLAKQARTDRSELRERMGERKAYRLKDEKKQQGWEP
jgi:hypothetical protein